MPDESKPTDPQPEPEVTAPEAAPVGPAAPADEATADAKTDDNVVVRTVELVKTFRSRSLRMFGRTTSVHAVQALNLEIHRGEVFGLLGPNGSGKSTTIKMLLGLLVPTGGRIEVLGEPPDRVSVKSRVGFLPEESYLYRFLTPVETLDFYGKLFGMPRKERRAKADELIEMVGLDHARNRPAREFSKGMARRLGLAQALINDPELVILDEPTSGLDPIGTAEIKHVIMRLRDQGKTVLLCSHLLADVEEICSRVAILCDGVLLAHGPIAELLELRERLEVQFDGADDGFAQRLEDFAKAEGVNMLTARRASDSLARLFLRLIDEKDPTKIPANLRDELLKSGADAGG